MRGEKEGKGKKEEKVEDGELKRGERRTRGKGEMTGLKIKRRKRQGRRWKLREIR